MREGWFGQHDRQTQSEFVRPSYELLQKKIMKSKQLKQSRENSENISPNQLPFLFPFNCNFLL